MDPKELKTYKRDALLGALGAEVSTWDFVLSQGSGNASLCIWMLVNAVWAGRQSDPEKIKMSKMYRKKA